MWPRSEGYCEKSQAENGRKPDFSSRVSQVFLEIAGQMRDARHGSLVKSTLTACLLETEPLVRVDRVKENFDMPKDKTKKTVEATTTFLVSWTGLRRTSANEMSRLQRQIDLRVPSRGCRMLRVSLYQPAQTPQYCATGWSSSEGHKCLAMLVLCDAACFFAVVGNSLRRYQIITRGFEILFAEREIKPKIADPTPT